MQQWHPISKFLHWLMAVLLFAMIGFGFAMTRLVELAEHSGDYSAKLLGLSIFDAFQLHKSVGVLLFGVLILRLLGRWLTPAAIHPDLSAFENAVAQLVHMLLYSLMLAFPISGWLLASSSTLGLPTFVFGIFHLPHPVAPNAGAEWFWAWVHFLCGVALLLLATMHIAAAFKYQFWDRDAVLSSMLPFLKHHNTRKSR